MVKYIICAKEEYGGTSTSDTPNPSSVTEIATELVITRLYCLMLLDEGVIDKTDVIVTGLERKCLYENIFDNVIDWNTYTTLDTSKNEKIDLLEPSLFNSLAGGSVGDRLIPYLPFYKNWDRDRKNIQNINYNDLTNYDTSNNFVCLLIRSRAAWSEKNLPRDYWVELIRQLELEGVKVFVFGKETEEYATEKTEYIKDFRDWCSIVSTISGGVYPAFICGRENIKLTIIDNLNLVPTYGYDPSWYNDCINFTKVSKNIINHLPSINNLKNIINEG